LVQRARRHGWEAWGQWRGEHYGGLDALPRFSPRALELRRVIENVIEKKKAAGGEGELT
jgi:hypothetical protein